MCAAPPGEPDLPLEVDPEATPMEHKICHPTLADLQYILGRWQHVWERRREDAVATAAGSAPQPPTPTHSTRLPEQLDLWGYPAL